MGKSVIQHVEWTSPTNSRERQGSVVDPDTGEKLMVASRISYSGAVAKTGPGEIALIRKLDIWIMPILWIMYLFNYLDRNAIAVARLNEMEEELGPSVDEYSTWLDTWRGLSWFMATFMSTNLCTILWPDKDAPLYRPALLASAAFSLTCAMGTWAMRIWLKRLNKKIAMCGEESILRYAYNAESRELLVVCTQHAYAHNERTGSIQYAGGLRC